MVGISHIQGHTRHRPLSRFGEDPCLGIALRQCLSILIRISTIIMRGQAVGIENTTLLALQ